jgi:radical SAM superfamily enzyme YgiQ (UPF0313 family)
MPARHLVKAVDYGTDNESLHSNFFTSRGCPARCAYCAGGLFGKGFRFRSADGVVNEMIAVHRAYGTRRFHFMDDAMTMDRQRMRRICDRLITERPEFTWTMMTRIDSVDDDLLERAARAGCIQVEYGVESGNPETLKKIHKPHSAEMVRRVIPMTHRHGIRSCVFFILGFPWDTVASIGQTLELMKDIAPYVDFHQAVASILIPFPGTEIYERYKDQYEFADWWLSDNRTYDAPQVDAHPYFESVLFRLGAVLDADFFRYTPEVKAKICEVFKYMYAHNLRQRGLAAQASRMAALNLSQTLYAVSPQLERAVFKTPARLWQAIKAGRR